MKPTATRANTIIALTLAPLFLLGVNACDITLDLHYSKDDGRRQRGRDSDGRDACERQGWYYDGVCDEFCMQPDPDCENGGGFDGGVDGGECASDRDCGPEAYCLDGWCQHVGGDVCFDDTECLPDEICDFASGTCLYVGEGGVPCIDDIDCFDGQICDVQAGYCTYVDKGPICLDDLDCFEGEYCLDGYCSFSGKCAVDEDCGGDAFCVNGLCQYDGQGEYCWSDADCYPGEVCEIDGGFCIPTGDPACFTDADCLDDEICNGKFCEVVGGPKCLDDAECQGGFCGKQGVCEYPTEKRPCQVDQDCGAGQFCFDGFCWQN
jgi:hypothetical protein